MANSFINEDYAKELQSELEEAIKINPDMFNLDKVAEYTKELQKFEGNFFETLKKLDQIYKEEVRFTEDERNAIKQVVTDAGHTIKEEVIKGTKKEIGEESFNPLRDDYYLVLDNNTLIHILKIHKRRGGFVVDAKEGIKVEYNILEFFTPETCQRFFNTAELEHVLYKPFDAEDYSLESNLDNLRKAFTLNSEPESDDDYWKRHDKYQEERRKERDKKRKKKEKKGAKK
jgi:hypothetical protein